MSMDQTVLEAKRIGVFNCTVNCSLAQAGKIMVDEDISALVVVDEDGWLAGIVTRTDLLRAWVHAKDLSVERLRDYMNPDVVTVLEDACLSDVAKILLEHQIHRVVIVRPEGEKNKPIAVVSAADLIYHMVNED
jgi:CBS domain-containing protein